MNASLRAFLTGIVDYAGLFPPAQLEFEPAFRNFLSYRRCPEYWMLGRFVCPAAKLGQFGSVKDLLTAESEPVRIAGLGRGGADAAAFDTGLATDLEAITSCHNQLAGRVIVDAFETRLPADVMATGDSAAIFGLLGRVRERLTAGAIAEVPCFLELPATERWRRDLENAIDALERQNQNAQQTPLGLKLRTGGLEAKAFPPSDQVVAVISACVKARVPLKCTAGLHHPIRRFDTGVRAYMHGFVNVFGAAILARTLPLTPPDVLAIVDEQDARTFRFDEEMFGWNDAEATASEVEFARKHFAISFGSCSFDEPCDDLRLLGWLPRERR